MQGITVNKYPSLSFICYPRPSRLIIFTRLDNDSAHAGNLNPNP